MVPHNTAIAPTTEKNVIKVVTKSHEEKLYIKRDSIDTANILERKGRRQISLNVKNSYKPI